MAAVATGGLGLVLLAPPVLAATNHTDDTDAPTTCRALDGTGGWGQGGMGQGMGQGMGRGAERGAGYGPGVGGPRADMHEQMTSGDIASTLPASGTLTTAQKQQLAAMAEEEKLAHDVYTVLDERTGDVRFARIAASEQQHLVMVRVLLARYGVSDPTAGRDAGAFASTATAKAYADYISKGSTSLDAALGVGRTIESEDIADLRAAVKGLDAPDVTTVYDRLATASSHHLAAFSR
ncbi:MAG: DUF2202 domain-containing protein [Angustibacter sp.]